MVPPNQRFCRPTRLPGCALEDETPNSWLVTIVYDCDYIDGVQHAMLQFIDDLVIVNTE